MLKAKQKEREREREREKKHKIINSNWKKNYYTQLFIFFQFKLQLRINKIANKKVH